MRSSASSCARQVLQAPLQKLTTTTSPRCSERRTFSPERPRATRSGAGCAEQLVLLGRRGRGATQSQHAAERKRSKTRLQNSDWSSLTNKRSRLAQRKGTPGKRYRIRSNLTRETIP